MSNTPETWAEKVARLQREIVERQAELARLVCGDPNRRVEVPVVDEYLFGAPVVIRPSTVR